MMTKKSTAVLDVAMETVSAIYAIPRRSVRTKANVPVRLMLEYRGQMVLRDSVVLDLSNRGVRVVATPEFKPGLVIQIIPAEGSRFAQKARVVWIGPPGASEERHAGLEFLNPARG
jgi:hypothetical protein